MSASELPYKVHTNRELGMMLRGRKPLAVFCDGYGQFPDVILRYLRLFDRQVEEGLFVKRDYVVPTSGPPVAQGFHTILYALSSEAWRIDAMIELRLSSSWSADHEREEGRLLGYEEWQNDLWVAKLSAKG